MENHLSRADRNLALLNSPQDSGKILQDVRPSILITGSPRSGTTWTSKMLSLSGGTVRARGEPFNANPGSCALKGLASNSFAYIPGWPEPRRELAKARYSDVMEGQCVCFRRPERWILKILPPPLHPRVVIKDSMAAFSAGWLGDNFPLQVVGLIRHPGAVVASFLSLGWEGYLQDVLNQSQLMADLPDDVEAQISREDILDPLVEAASLWKLVYTAVAHQASERQGWQLVRHEDLAQDPVAGFERLYSALGLSWGVVTRRRIEKWTRPENPAERPSDATHLLRRDSRSIASLWQGQLTTDEKAKVREVASPVWELFYDEDTW